MTKEFWTISEVLEIFEMRRQLLAALEEEDIVTPRRREDDGESLYSREEMEMLRVAKILADELEVNLAGVDIILRMRRQMIEMRKQFDDILADIAEKLKERL